MKSLAIKTSNAHLINYLTNELSNSSFEGAYYSIRNFKNNTNVIIHYLGKDVSYFYDFICNMLSNFVIDNYEIKILKRLLNLYYFYFNDMEKSDIIKCCNEIIRNKDYTDYDYRYEQIYIAMFDYISNNKNIYIDGFIDFRLISYYKSLTDLLDIGVKKYLIDKEYNEFISLLKAYIVLTESSCDIVHAIYNNSKISLLDENLKLIDVSNYLKLKTGFSNSLGCNLSDISFSNNDLVLNTLLSLAPKKIIVHCYTASDDEFINTLKMVFEKRLEFCSDCNICNIFSNKNSVKGAGAF